MKSSVFLNEDSSGTFFWRGQFSINILWPLLGQDESISIAKTLPPDPNFFAIQNSVMIQRWTTPQHRQLFDSAIFPASQGGMCNVIYNIDDCMSSDEIPTFNPAWFHYSKKDVQDNINHIMQRSDFVLVTTARLKQYYVEKYNILEENIIIIPNMLPRSWAFGLYNTEKQEHFFKTDKPRIGIISSSSHFNVHGIKQCNKTKTPTIYNPDKGLYQIAHTNDFLAENEVSEIPDDIDDIIEVIEATHEQFEWVIIGKSKNSAFKKLEDEKKIIVVSQTPITHYMQLVSSLNLTAIIAPVKDNLFNWCKSDIKYLESAAVGALLFTPNVLPYTENVPEDQRYTSNNDLINKLSNLAGLCSKQYIDLIQAQYNYLNSPPNPSIDGPYLKNWWLDDNIDIWKRLLFMPRKGVKLHFSSIVNEKE